jgi:hypothetical protein
MLGAWEASSGRAMLQCRGGAETIRSEFRNLIPNGLYTLFVVHFDVQSGPGRFTPLGAADGSNDSFVANAAGQGQAMSSVSPCLTPGSEAVVLVWNSDGQTHGSSIGSPGITSHNQLIFRVPPSGTNATPSVGAAVVTPHVVSSDGAFRHRLPCPSVVSAPVRAKSTLVRDRAVRDSSGSRPRTVGGHHQPLRERERQ